MLSRLYRYGQWPNSHDLLKVYAVLLMVVDHIGAYVYPELAWLRIVGRGAAPCFFFLAGLTPSKYPRASLWIYGAVLTAVYVYAERYFLLNILINFALIRLFFLRRQDAEWTAPELTATFMRLIVLNILCYPFIEYGTSGLIFAISAQLFIQKNPHAPICLAVAIVNHFMWEALGLPKTFTVDNWILFIVIACLTFLILLFYRERTWKIPKGTRALTLFLSRYSLEIYFWHLLLLRLWFYAAAFHLNFKIV